MWKGITPQSGSTTLPSLLRPAASGEQTLSDALRALREDAPGMRQIEGEVIKEAEQW